MIHLENFHLSDSTLLFCPMVFDSYLCWPKTKAGEKVWQRCPEGVRGLDNESKFFHTHVYQLSETFKTLIVLVGALLEFAV